MNRNKIIFIIYFNLRTRSRSRSRRRSKHRSRSGSKHRRLVKNILLKISKKIFFSVLVLDLDQHVVLAQHHGRILF
jgi:hypothetical protein